MLDKLETGMYVRTNDGFIAKFVERKELPINYYPRYEYYFDAQIWDSRGTDGEYDDHELHENKIKELKMEPSFEVIDLLQVGDIITFKNDDEVYRIGGVSHKDDILRMFYLNRAFDGEFEDIRVSYEEMKNTIERICTKEQFERCTYEVK